MVRYINPARRHTHHQRPAMLRMLQTDSIIRNSKNRTLLRPHLHTMARLLRLPPHLQHRNHNIRQTTPITPAKPSQSFSKQKTAATQPNPNFTKILICKNDDLCGLQSVVEILSLGGSMGASGRESILNRAVSSGYQAGIECVIDTAQR